MWSATTTGAMHNKGYNGMRTADEVQEIHEFYTAQAAQISPNIKLCFIKRRMT